MTIASDVLRSVIAHARECQPSECCGILLGRPDRILAAVRGRNVADQPASAFLLEPKDHIDARRTARMQGLDVVGFYHSHPRSPAYPSATDLAEATYPGSIHLIVGFIEDGPEIRVFSYSHGGAHELEFVAL